MKTPIQTLAATFTSGQVKMFFTALCMTWALQAFSIGGERDFRGNITSSGTHFVKGTSSQRWNNATSQSDTKANYANFDGETFVWLMAYDKQTDVLLESNVQVTSGQLCMIVESSLGEVVFEKTFQKDQTIYATVTLDVYEQYKVRFIGGNATGSYQCQWTALN